MGLTFIFTVSVVVRGLCKNRIRYWASTYSSGVGYNSVKQGATGNEILFKGDR